MRITQHLHQKIVSIVAQQAGADAKVYLFGSRVDDQKTGGDIDLYVESPQAIEHYAMLAANIGAKVMRAAQGRKVDVVMAAPNIAPQPIHHIARQYGVQL